MIRAIARLALALMSALILPACEDGVHSYLRAEADWFGLEVAQGGVAVRKFRILEKQNINSKIRLTVEPPPAGVTVEVIPLELGATGNEATVTIRVAPDANLGGGWIGIRVEEVGYDTLSFGNFMTVVLFSDGPDFGIESDTEVPTLWAPESFALWNLHLRAVQGFEGEVFLSASVPAQPYLGISTPDPASLTLPGSDHVTLTATLLAAPPEPVEIEITITATGMGRTHTGTLRVRVVPATVATPGR